MILNHSHNHTRRIDIEIGVDYNANMDVVSKTLLDLRFYRVFFKGIRNEKWLIDEFRAH